MQRDYQLHYIWGTLTCTLCFSMVTGGECGFAFFGYNDYRSLARSHSKPLTVIILISAQKVPGFYVKSL